MKASPYEILVRPIITEDGMYGSSLEEPLYIFKVQLSANKIQIAQAVEEAFNVRVKNVNTLRQRGKIKSMRGRRGKRADYKKAFVTLEKGSKIDLL